MELLSGVWSELESRRSEEANETSESDEESWRRSQAEYEKGETSVHRHDEQAIEQEASLGHDSCEEGGVEEGTGGCKEGTSSQGSQGGMMAEKYDELAGTLIARTKKAALVDYGTGEVWTPLSVLSEESRREVEEAEPGGGEEIDFEVAHWFVEKEGLLQ